MRKGLLVIAALAFVALVIGCGYNYSGKGNEFELIANIDHVGKRSITVRVYSVDWAKGEADGWFAKGERHQIHNNYNECDWSSPHTVGRVYKANGHNSVERISIDDLRPGETVLITGKIRRNASTCGKSQRIKWRPVYDGAYLFNVDRATRAYLRRIAR